METPLEPLSSHAHLNAPATFDPTAHLEEEFTPTHHQNPVINALHSIGYHKPRYYLIKLFSLALILHGFIYLFERVEEIFFVFPKLPTLFQSLDFSKDVYLTLVYKTIILSASSVVETIFGVFLATKKSHLVHDLHLVAAVLMFILSYILLKVMAPIDLNHLEAYGLAFLLQSQTL